MNNMKRRTVIYIISLLLLTGTTGNCHRTGEDTGIDGVDDSGSNDSEDDNDEDLAGMSR